MKVRLYEDRELQIACLNQIPIPELFEAAKKRVEEACGSSYGDIRDEDMLISIKYDL